MNSKVLDAEVVERVTKWLDAAIAFGGRCIQTPDTGELPYGDLRAILSELSRLQAIIGPLEGLRELSEKATAGPWEAEANTDRGAWIGRWGKWAALSCGDADGEGLNNAAFIAAMENTIRSVLSSLQQEGE